MADFRLKSHDICSPHTPQAGLVKTPDASRSDGKSGMSCISFPMKGPNQTRNNARLFFYLNLRDQFLLFHARLLRDTDAVFLQDRPAARVHTFTDQHGSDGDRGHLGGSSVCCSLLEDRCTGGCAGGVTMRLHHTPVRDFRRNPAAATWSRLSRVSSCYVSD